MKEEFPMKKSNRRAAWLLSLCMALGLVLPGSTAALAAADDAADGTLEFPEAGITLNLPEEFENTHGVIIPYGGFDVTGGAGIYETALLYFAMDQEAYDTYTENTNPTEEEFNNFWNSSAWLVLILSADNGLTFDEVNEYAAPPGTARTTSMKQESRFRRTQMPCSWRNSKRSGLLPENCSMVPNSERRSIPWTA